MAEGQGGRLSVEQRDALHERFKLNVQHYNGGEIVWGAAGPTDEDMRLLLDAYDALAAENARLRMALAWKTMMLTRGEQRSRLITRFWERWKTEYFQAVDDGWFLTVLELVGMEDPALVERADGEA